MCECSFYKFFQKIRKCKIPKNPSFTCIDYGDFAQRGEFLAGWFSGDEPHYKNIDDIDIATIYTPKEIQKLFEQTDVKVIETGVEHGSVTLLLNKCLTYIN